MKKYILELQSSEGGEDSKLLVDEMLGIYQKVMQKNNFKYSILEKRIGYVSIWLLSEEAYKFFKKEVGGHRWQRIPPTEKSGRTHTSIILVSLTDQSEVKYQIDKKDVQVIFTRGTGPGGQHRNKVETCVILKHVPTNISVRIDGRSRLFNEREAWSELENRLSKFANRKANDKFTDIKRFQLGQSSRSNKIRTYNEKTGTVINHLNDKKITFRELYKGNLEKIQ